MTGFQFGRKLGDWGKDNDPEEKASKVGFCHLARPLLHPYGLETWTLSQAQNPKEKASEDNFCQFV